jgi:PmbA protein
MSRTLPDLTEALLNAARLAGAENADAIAVRSISQDVQVRAASLEEATRSDSVEIGLRVLLGRRQACVSASDTRDETIAEMAERAVAMARLAPEDPHIGLADPEQLARDTDASALDLCDDSGEPDPETLKEAALRAEAAALELKGIERVMSSNAGFTRGELHLAATNGFSGGYARTSHAHSVVALTGRGTEMERDYFVDQRTHRADLMDPAEVGRIAARRTLARAGARKPRTGAYPVLYDERVASGLIGHLLQAANGQMVARGSSWLSDRLGEKVLPDGIDLIETPHRPRVSSSKPFDAEGLPTRERAIVRGGVLQGWTLDLATGRKLGMESTGNATRGTSSPPSPGTGGIRLTQGEQSRDDLIAEMGTGLLVTSLIGSSINPTTGDYSRGASGFWVENGQIAWPVNECTIAGNLLDMLRSIRPANDARLHLSRVVPSVLVEGLTVAGE